MKKMINYPVVFHSVLLKINVSLIYVNKKATTTIEYYDNTYIFIASFMEITLSE